MLAIGGLGICDRGGGDATPYRLCFCCGFICGASTKAVKAIF